MQFADFLWSVLISSAATAALLGWAAWHYKALISQWLAKDLLSLRLSHEQDLQAKKLVHERELEAYRTSLIAAAEAVKASQEVKKATALLVAEKEFAALNELHRLTLGNATDVLALYAMEGALSDEHHQQLRDRYGSLGQAIDHYALFHVDMDGYTAHQQHVALLDYKHALIERLNECRVAERVRTGDAFEEIKSELLDKEILVDRIVRKILFRLRSMG